MPSPTSSDALEWFRYPSVAVHDLAKTWLTTETLLGLAPKALDAYARGLDDFLGFCQRADTNFSISVLVAWPACDATFTRRKSQYVDNGSKHEMDCSKCCKKSP
jgi:hypothetical protein